MVFPRTAGAFRCILLCGICMDPHNWTGFITIGLFSERIKQIRGKTHSISSRCAVCKLNTVERSDDLSNNSRISAQSVRTRLREIGVRPWRPNVYIHSGDCYSAKYM